MTQQFKVLTYILPLKISKKEYHPYEFEEIINKHLQDGWRVINCESIYLGGVSPENGIHYTAYLHKE
ncbi:MAG: hypothetical protein ACFFFB_25595 [Candidatus Heimdallarchaeota archaeon]